MTTEKDLTKVLDGAEDDLKKILQGISANPNTSFDSQKIIDITHYGVDKQEHQVVTLHLGDKYTQFYDEFTQTALSIPELKPLAEYVMNEKNGWSCNLD